MLLYISVLYYLKIFNSKFFYLRQKNLRFWLKSLHTKFQNSWIYETISDAQVIFSSPKNFNYSSLSSFPLPKINQKNHLPLYASTYENAVEKLARRHLAGDHSLANGDAIGLVEGYRYSVYQKYFFVLNAGLLLAVDYLDVRAQDRLDGRLDLVVVHFWMRGKENTFYGAVVFGAQRSLYPMRWSR